MIEEVPGSLVDVMTDEIDRHWLDLRDGKAYCTCGGWSLDPVSPVPIEVGDHLKAFSRHVAQSLAPYTNWFSGYRYAKMVIRQPWTHRIRSLWFQA